MKRLAPALIIAAVVAALTVSGSVAAQTEPDRLAALETRVSALEAYVGLTTTTTAPTTTTPTPTTTTTAAPAECAGNINVPQDGTDVSRAIADQINALPDGSTASFAPGRYRIEGSVVIKGVDNLTIDGCGATFYRDNDSPARMWQLTEQTGTTLRNMVIDGPHATAGPDAPFLGSMEGAHGLALIGVTGATIENVTIRQVHGDGVNVRDNGATGTRTTSVTMTGLRVESAGRQGVAITNADNVTIQGSYLGGCRLKCWDVEPNAGGVVRDAVLRDSVIGPSGSFAVGANGRDGATVDGAYVLDNRFLVDMRWGFGGNSAATLRDYRVEGNVAEQPARACFRNAKDDTVCGRDVLLISNVDGVVVANNRQPLPQGIDFFDPSRNSNVTVEGNT